MPLVWEGTARYLKGLGRIDSGRDVAASPAARCRCRCRCRRPFHHLI